MRINGDSKNSDQVLNGLVCPACGTDALWSPINGYSACWCRACGANVRLHTTVDPRRPGGLNVQVVGRLLRAE